MSSIYNITDVVAPLGIPNGYYKTEIVGINNDKCVVRNFGYDNKQWVLYDEYLLPINYAKELSLLIMKEIKNPNERLVHLKKYCQIQKHPTMACVYLENGNDRNNYFYHIDLGLYKYNKSFKTIK